MVSKKALGIIFASLIGVSLVALTPVFIYGFTINAVEVNMQIMTSSGTLSSSLIESNSETYDYDIWDGSFNVPPEAQEKVISAYEYFFSKWGGQMTVEEEGVTGEQYVSILITFELTTPTNKSLTFSFQPTDLRGEGLIDITILLGPDEFDGETGEFSLTIVISIVVTLPPPLSTTILDLDLIPVNLTFVVSN